MDKYADKLSEGQKGMFKRFPDTFRMPVYQSRRDFRYPDVICEVAKKNALEAELIDGGLGYTGYKGPIGFPIPEEPMEVLANMNFPYRAFTEEMVRDIADVGSDGSITWDDVAVALRQKHHALEGGGVLQLQTDMENFAAVGGQARLKRWLDRRREAFVGDAEALGLDAFE